MTIQERIDSISKRHAVPLCDLDRAAIAAAIRAAILQEREECAAIADDERNQAWDIGERIRARPAP